MDRSFKTLWKLFISSFYISAFTFGGGYVIVPLLRKKFVDELKWIDETEMLDLIAIAQSSPGPIAVNASILIGYRISGVLGALVTTLGTVLPCLIILTIVSYFYSAFKESVVVNAVLKAMRSAVAAIIADVVITMVASITKQKRILSNAIMIIAFLITYFTNINMIFVIFVCAFIGILDMKVGIKNKARKDGDIL